MRTLAGSSRAIALSAFALIALGAPAASAKDEPRVEADATPPPPPPSSSVRESAAKPVVVWPTLTPAGDDTGTVSLHKPSASEGRVHARAQELDATLRDAVQDLGFTLDLADEGPSSGKTRDLDLLDRASHTFSRVPAGDARGTATGTEDQGTWVLSARLEPLGGDQFILRIVAVPPKGKQLRVRVEKVSGADVSVRGLVLARDLLAIAPPSSPEAGARPQESGRESVMSPLRSQGRAVLAANAALFGAFTAFSIQRASGSEDPRLLYPLLALGTGVGLGSALLVAEEWDVGTGDAWTLSGAAWWGTAAGIFIANGRHVVPLTDRYAWGIGGGLIGLSLATLAVARERHDEGDALLVNSGAALGFGLGALGEFFYVGDIQNRTPYTGAGYGSALGLVAGGTLAALFTVSASRVMLVDLGAGLGAAAGAAIGSPLVFEDVTPGKARGFVAATAGGTLVGGTIAWLLTREKPAKELPAKPSAVTPYGGVVGTSATREGNVPAYGIGVRGAW
ncbi:MAG: hypothetical protein JST00_12735 [Deltaproteobacteria bacterium]|nr:hypothetical protein [Deltaproteobacteria bacterium]